MFQNIYEVRISGKDVKRFVKKLYNNKIFIEELKYVEKSAYLKLDKENYKRLKEIKTIYQIELVRMYGTIKIINQIKNNSFFIVSFLIAILYLIFLSNIIFKVEVIHSDKNIRELLYRELEVYGIKKHNFVKSYNQKEKIKKKILNDYKEKLEWIEINRIGTKYEIRVEERIINNIKEDKTPTHVIASKAGIINKITSTKGEIVKKKGDYVKKGDILISGLIKKGDDIKNKVNAEGEVYAEVWYKTSVSMPFYYREERLTKDKKKTLKIKFLGKVFNIMDFNKYKSYKEDKIFGLKNRILPIEITFSTDTKTIVKENVYTKEEAIEEGLIRSNAKIEGSLGQNEKILKTKILKTEEYENYVNIDIFYKVYECISVKRQITEEDLKLEEKTN